ncbi:MAG: MarR family transcriptional regulator [Verrucomicrobiota bacterium]|nr:MarR family transcriptional regulator [Verrucomicrobiota bacterium]
MQNIAPNDKKIQELAHIMMRLQRCFLISLSHQLAKGNISISQYTLLSFLNQDESRNMSQLAQLMGHTTAAATGLIDRMVEAGYVERFHSTEDRRKVLVRITQKGVGVVQAVQNDISKNLGEVMKVLSADEQEYWLAIYRKVNDFYYTKPVEEK